VPRQSKTPRPRGFTLVELLVVVGVIALLIGLLLPALGSARRAAHLAVSMSNMRQITTAAVNYSHHNDDDWPVIPVMQPLPGQSGPVLFNSWNWGGKTSDEYWKTHGSINYIPSSKRVLNSWVYPDLELRDRVNVLGVVKRRMELDVFRCPSDVGTYQRGFWKEDPARDLTISSYDDVGTSYHLNVKWWYASERPGESLTQRWNRTEPMFRRGGLGGPSMFVWCYDQIMDVVTHHDSITREGDHGGLNRAKAAYMDGHVSYLQAQPGKEVTNTYWLLLE
jgi:prepilin-type N-terminal cleavage/methylation domain-containing protein